MIGWRRRSSTGHFAKETPLASVRFVVLDTELTSLNSKTNRLLSVGAIAMTGPRIHVGEQFYRVVNPGVLVPTEGVKIHKLRQSDIESGELPDSVLADLQSFIKGAVLVGHFAEIDVKVLRKEFSRIGYELNNLAVCTARVHRWVVQKQQYTEDQFQKMENSDLASLATLYNLGVHDAHHALDDAFITARLWQKLLHEIGGKGIATLGQLVKIGAI